MRILVTGAAGFIGSHLCRRLLARGDKVYAIDDFSGNSSLQRDRLRDIQHDLEFLEELDLTRRNETRILFGSYSFDAVVHLAAEPGIRCQDQSRYIDSNLVAFSNVLESCRRIRHFIYASSSSVYGNGRTPSRVGDIADQPVSVYAATKRSNELLAHAYANELASTGLRFFTVYGPWGRPDMAVWKFTEAILGGKPIDIYNRGNMRRDFTYIDDAISAIVLAIDRPADRYRLLNVGSGTSVPLVEMVETLESVLGIKANRHLCPSHPGDVMATHACIRDTHDEIGWRPRTNLREGLWRFAEWYLDYRNAWPKCLISDFTSQRMKDRERDASFGENHVRTLY